MPVPHVAPRFSVGAVATRCGVGPGCCCWKCLASTTALFVNKHPRSKCFARAAEHCQWQHLQCPCHSPSVARSWPTAWLAALWRAVWQAQPAPSRWHMVWHGPLHATWLTQAGSRAPQAHWPCTAVGPPGPGSAPQTQPLAPLPQCESLPQCELAFVHMANTFCSVARRHIVAWWHPLWPAMPQRV